MITKGKMFWSFIEFSLLILEGNVKRSVCMWILIWGLMTNRKLSLFLLSISWLLTVVKPFRIPLFFHFLQNQESWMWQNWDILYHLFLVSVQVSWRLKKGHQSLCLIGFMDLSLLESIMRVTFSQMSMIYSCRGFSCCLYN